MIITSLHNSIFKDLFLLKEKRARDKSGLFFVEGKKQIEEICKTWEITNFIVSQNYKFMNRPPKNLLILSEKLFSKLADTKTPQGIIAVVRKKVYDEEKILERKGLFIIVENIQDPGNLGTIIRCADAFNINAVFTSKNSVDIYSSKTIRSSMGSIFHLPVIDKVEIFKIISSMKLKDIGIFAASLKGKNFLNNITLPKSCAFIIGNESVGISEETKKIIDKEIKIKMIGKAESLNAAMAAAIIMYSYQNLRNN
jgi:TrmH family RNA methyltransferase